jgi:hypothetical protein
VQIALLGHEAGGTPQGPAAEGQGEEVTEQIHCLCIIIATAMSAQTFNGVTMGGTATRPTILNQSDKPIMGYAVQRTTTTGIDPVFSVVDLQSLTTGEPIQPGEERWLGPFNVVRVSSMSRDKGEPISHELKGVLFTDGTYCGLDFLFPDFSSRISTVRSLARDAQCAGEDKYTILAQHKVAFADPQTILKAMRTPSVDSRALALRYNMAGIILSIRDTSGEQEAEAALARLAALPDVVKGE